MNYLNVFDRIWNNFRLSILKMHVPETHLEARICEITSHEPPPQKAANKQGESRGEIIKGTDIAIY